MTADGLTVIDTARLVQRALARPLLVLALAATGGAAATAAMEAAMPALARAAAFLPGKLVVGYRTGPAGVLRADVAKQTGGTVAEAAASGATGTALITLPPHEDVRRAATLLRSSPGIAYAVPDYLAHADAADAAPGWYPNDPGRPHRRGGWEALQWNFLPGSGVNAPEAWANLRGKRRPGGKGVIVAVLDTGVAYRRWKRFRRSPDFNHTRFVDPYDFVAHNRFPLDHEGHGTFVTGTIAESTNNGIGLTGLAYGASIMPIRVLDADGTGDALTIARGIRFAVRHHARVINLSLEFTPDVTGADIPEILSALRFADRHRVTVVAASGNEALSQIAFPARATSVISVGATTKDRCLAEYSNGGPTLSLVAPGGGTDTSLLTDPNCHPGRRLPPIYQMTFPDPSDPRRFGIPGGIFGTSMATPHVAAAVALVLASDVLGPNPTPEQIRTHLELTAQPLGNGRPNSNYGWGLLDAGAATAPIATAPAP